MPLSFRRVASKQYLTVHQANSLSERLVGALRQLAMPAGAHPCLDWRRLLPPGALGLRAAEGTAGYAAFRGRRGTSAPISRPETVTMGR